MRWFFFYKKEGEKQGQGFGIYKKEGEKQGQGLLFTKKKEKKKKVKALVFT